jgi:hypothetical protein
MEVWLIILVLAALAFGIYMIRKGLTQIGYVKFNQPETPKKKTYKDYQKTFFWWLLIGYVICPVPKSVLAIIFGALAVTVFRVIFDNTIKKLLGN